MESAARSGLEEGVWDVRRSRFVLEWKGVREEEGDGRKWKIRQKRRKDKAARGKPFDVRARGERERGEVGCREERENTVCAYVFSLACFDYVSSSS